MLQNKYSTIVLILSTIIYLLIFLAYFLYPVKSIIGYTTIYISTSVFFIVLCWQIFLLKISQKYIYSFLAAIVILRIVFIPVHPIGSDDYYRYLWDGKLQVNGINPYAYAPDAKELTYLHSEILPKYVNHANMKTLYPPLTEILFYISYLTKFSDLP